MPKKFADIIVGHTFAYVESGQIPKDQPKFKCSFCGGEGRNWVKIRRDDGVEYLIGNTCLTKVGLSQYAKKGTVAAKKPKKVIAEAASDTPTPKEIAPEVKVEAHKEGGSPDDIDELLDQLNTSK